jgi:hypothetical protein
MRVYFLCIILFGINFYSKASTEKKYLAIVCHIQPPDTLIGTLISLNLSQYNGRPVDTLLAHLPSGIVDMKITGWRSIRLAEVLHIIYPNKVVVEIHVKQFEHMNPHWVNTSNPTQNWSIALFRKEKIAHCIVFNNSACIYGCESEYK